MKHGWRRETLVREYSKSGVRGDVCYYAPCGKKFKQYPDIIRVIKLIKHKFIVKKRLAQDSNNKLIYFWDQFHE